MPYVQRDDAGNLCAISQVKQANFSEWLNDSDTELVAFLSRINPSLQELTSSDLDFVRVVEDVIELLIDKNLVRFTDLPAPAQSKMMKRRKLRKNLKGTEFDLFDDDEDIKLL